MKKGKLQLYLDNDGKITANPGPGNKLYNVVAKRREAKRSAPKKVVSKSSTARSRKSSASPSVDKTMSVVTTAGKRPFTRGASRQSEALLNKVLAESKSLHEAKVGKKKTGDATGLGIPSVMKEVYGTFPTIESQLSLQTDDSCSLAGGMFDFEEIEAYPGDPGAMVEDEESVKAWDLHAELDQALLPLAASLADGNGNGESVAVNDAS